MEYIVGLSDDGKIPRLFGQAGSNTAYWVSSGTYTAGSNNPYDEGFTGEWGSDKTAVVRCVYDVWYWGEQDIEHDENNPEGRGHLTNTDFVWGDAPDGTLKEGTKNDEM